MKSFLPVVAFAALVTPAAAQDTNFDFSGFLLNHSASQPNTSSDTLDNDLEVDTNSFALSATYLVNVGDFFDFDVGGFFNLGDFVVGGDITLRHSDYSYTLNGVSLSSTTARSTALGLRAGYPIGRVMPFVSARIGRGTYDANGGSLDIDTREWGIGAEVALIESVSLLASYDRATFERRDLDAEADSDAFSIGIGYRF